MMKRRYFLVLLAVAVVVGVLVWSGGREREPEYGGKRLSEWVKTYPPRGPHEASEVADDAIKHIGTNAIPYLLNWMSYEAAPSQVRFYTSKFYQGLPEFWRGPFNGPARKDDFAMSAS